MQLKRPSTIDLSQLPEISMSETSGCEGTCLHSNHSIDEKDHGDEQTDIGQSLRRARDVSQHDAVIHPARSQFPTDLKGLDERPKESSDAFAFTEQLDQPQHSEQAEEGDGHFPTFSFALQPATASNSQ